MVGTVLEIVESPLYLPVSSLKAMVIHSISTVPGSVLYTMYLQQQRKFQLLITSLKMARLGTHEQFPSLISPLVDLIG